jgi:hypothetical protein
MATAVENARSADLRSRVVLGFLAIVTLGWMAGIGFGIARAVSDDPVFVADVGAWLTPALQGVIAVAITPVAVALTAIVRRIRVRADTMSKVLPDLLPAKE